MQVGLDFFSSRQFDLLRHVQVLFLEQRSLDAAVLCAHQRHSQEFGDFLQLDVPARERKGHGAHGVLARLFPMTLGNKVRQGKPGRKAATARLAGYEIGSWRCACGSFAAGHARRHDFACPCGRTSGNGLLGTDGRPCASRGCPPAYTTCPDCGTARHARPVLADGARGVPTRPAYRLPVTADLIVERPNGPEEAVRLVLLLLPLMLGVREKDGAIVFDPPDLFWVESRADPDAPRFQGRLLSLAPILSIATDGRASVLSWRRP